MAHPGGDVQALIAEQKLEARSSKLEAPAEPLEARSSKLEARIDHPSHYNQGKIEVIDVIEAWRLGFHLGNTVKYVARAGAKAGSDEAEDLGKAAWYIRRAIERQDSSEWTLGSPVDPGILPAPAVILDWKLEHDTPKGREQTHRGRAVFEIWCAATSAPGSIRRLHVLNALRIIEMAIAEARPGGSAEARPGGSVG